MYQEWSVTLPELTGEEERRAYIYVPDASLARPERRYPVLYMFDGQNLFADSDATFGKSWGLLEYVTAHDLPLIVAAVECSHHAEDEPCGGRLSEYSPFDLSDRRLGDICGRGTLTMDYYVNCLKPYVDENYPTQPDRAHTFIACSSMGGLMTIYALMAYNHVFSRGAALSPSVAFAPEAVKELIRSARIGRTVLYMDNGAREMRSRWAKNIYADVTAELIRKGVLLESRVVPKGIHSEVSWERQIPFFMDVLFYDLT